MGNQNLGLFHPNKSKDHSSVQPLLPFQAQNIHEKTIHVCTVKKKKVPYVKKNIATTPLLTQYRNNPEKKLNMYQINNKKN